MAEINRTELLIGTKALEKLQNSHIIFFGIGAVGSFALESIVRSGIGEVTLIDSDVVQKSNLNRQLVAYNSTLGQAKVEVAKNRVLDINPNCIVNVIHEYATEENIPQILSQKVDYVIDAIDSVNSKLALLEYCYHNNIPIISSMGAGGRVDPSRIQVKDISKTLVCPLARKLRVNLKKRKIYRGIKCVFSTEEYTISDDLNFEVTTESTDQGWDRLPLGTIATVTGTFGLRLASVAINQILGLKSNY